MQWWRHDGWNKKGNWLVGRSMGPVLNPHERRQDDPSVGILHNHFPDTLPLRLWRATRRCCVQDPRCLGILLGNQRVIPRGHSIFEEVVVDIDIDLH
jgi:hypothetical protein